MGRIVVTEFVTLDDVFEDPGGSEGKAYGGWQRPLMGDDDATYKMKELQAADALLLGRVTYEGFAAAWPAMQHTDQFGELMNSLPKHVATLTLSEFSWNNSQALGSEILTAVTGLKDQYERDILVAGSGTLVRSLLENNLVDELRLMTYPLVLGQGRRLFDGVQRQKLRYIGCQEFKNGTVVLSYGQKEAAA